MKTKIIESGLMKVALQTVELIYSNFADMNGRKKLLGN